MLVECRQLPFIDDVTARGVFRKTNKFTVVRSFVFSLPSKTIKIKIYRTVIVVCGYETWSLTLREERRLRVFENRVLRRILGLKGTR